MLCYVYLCVIMNAFHLVHISVGVQATLCDVKKNIHTSLVPYCYLSKISDNAHI